MLETAFFGFMSMVTSILQFTFIDRSKSDEDLLLMSQTVYDQLDPLSRSHQLCLCDQNKVSCSYQYQGCTTKNKGKEYLCGLHTEPKIRRDVQRVPIFKKDDEEINVISVTLSCRNI